MNLLVALMTKDKNLAKCHEITMNARRKKMEFYSTVLPRYYRDLEVKCNIMEVKN